MIVLDARGGADEERADAAVRAAASLTLELARARGCLLLLPGQRRPASIERDLAAWPAAHARLALVEGGPGALAPMLAGARGRSGPVFYGVASGLERPPAALGRGPVVIVAPAGVAPAPAMRAVFEVSGCVGFVPGRQAGATTPVARAAS
jgi:hypothetical protein